MRNRLAGHQATIDALTAAFPTACFSFSADHDLVGAQIVDVVRMARR